MKRRLLAAAPWLALAWIVLNSPALIGVEYVWHRQSKIRTVRSSELYFGLNPERRAGRLWFFPLVRFVRDQDRHHALLALYSETSSDIRLHSVELRHDDWRHTIEMERRSGKSFHPAPEWHPMTKRENRWEDRWVAEFISTDVVPIPSSIETFSLEVRFEVRSAAKSQMREVVFPCRRVSHTNRDLVIGP